MTVVVYDERQLFVDSKKIANAYENNSYGYLENKLTIIAGGSIAYASYGHDIYPGNKHQMEKAIIAAIFMAWIGEKLTNTSDKEQHKRYGTAFTYWTDACEHEFKTPLYSFSCVAVSKDAAVNIEHTSKKIESVSYSTITDGSICEAASATAYRALRMLGNKPIDAVNAIIKTSDICSLPVNSVRQEDLKDHNYEEFVDLLVAQREAKQ